MQLWIAVIICLAGFGLTAGFIRAYRRNKKKRFLALTATAALIALLMLAYAALTLILVGGID